MKHIFQFNLFVLGTLLFPLTLAAYTPLEIMQKVQTQSRIHKTQKTDVEMKIFDSKNRKRERFFTSQKKNKTAKSGEGLTSSLIRFYRPADIKNTGFLNYSYDNKNESDQWIYLPAFRTIKKISSEDKNKSFMGSDFSNADVGGRTLTADVHTAYKKETADHAFILSIPKDKNDQYSKIEYKVSKKIWVIEETVFYDKSNKLLKTLTTNKVKKVKGMYIVTQSVMRNKKTNGYTTLDVLTADVGMKLSDALFTTKGLRL